MKKEHQVKIDISKIKMAIQAGIPLSITTYTLPHEMEVYMGDVLTAFLNELNQGQMVEYLNYCLEELINNAKKANTKRVYFEDKHLDITKQHDYDVGMQNFKSDMLNNLKFYLSEQKKRGCT